MGQLSSDSLSYAPVWGHLGWFPVLSLVNTPTVESPVNKGPKAPYARYLEWTSRSEAGNFSKSPDHTAFQQGYPGDSLTSPVSAGAAPLMSPRGGEPLGCVDGVSE